MTALETAGERAGEKLHDEMQALVRVARAAAAIIARATPAQRSSALNRAADALRAAHSAILDANRRDLQSARDKKLSPAMVDRLMLDDKRIEAMVSGLAEVAALPDPIGTVLADWTRPNGLRIQRVRVPLGVIGIIYESRPNVTADAGGLCIRSGNAAILRGGSESFHSSRAIVAALEDGLERAGLPRGAVQLVPTTDRAAVGHMLAMNDLIDVIVPRGGRTLIERVQTESRLPVIAHLEGVCHVYLDRAAEPAFVARRRRCWWTAPSPTRCCRQSWRTYMQPAARSAATRRYVHSIAMPRRQPSRIGTPNTSTPSLR